MQNHPLQVLRTFLDTEAAYKTAKQYDKMRFVGYVLEIGYDTVTVITSDPFKLAVGGVPRNSLLVMVPQEYGDLPPHFTLLRVLESAPTPLSNEVQQTYFELQKKSMPELDVFTQSELQWGALKTGVLGMFYVHPDTHNAIEFSGDVNNFVSAHKYLLYAPNDELLNLIVNCLVPASNQFELGKLRLTECRLPLPDKPLPNVPVMVSSVDFVGARTAMFGKTRLGKSNVVKLIAQSIIENTNETKNVGQLIFDINGEYANDNPQDGNTSLRSAFTDRCVVYALSEKVSTPSHPLKLNFYERPDSTMPIIAGFLRQYGKPSAYIDAFASVELPSIHEVETSSDRGAKNRMMRKLQIFWAILFKAGFDVDTHRLHEIAPSGNGANKFNPSFNAPLRTAAYSAAGISPVPSDPNTLGTLRSELEILARFRRENTNNPTLISTSGNQIFDANDVALLEFLVPMSGRSGTSLLQPYKVYHDRHAGDFVHEIMTALNQGMTVILDLGNASDQILSYFSDELSRQVFNNQVEKFSNNNLGTKYIQLYFEEAHNLFPPNNDSKTIYSRFAKEGAKYHIGMVYSTQSPTTISRDLLAQTENFFIAHLASEDDVNALAKVNVAYLSLKGDILMAKTPGYMRMLTRSNRFVVSVQAHKFEPSPPRQEVN